MAYIEIEASKEVIEMMFTQDNAMPVEKNGLPQDAKLQMIAGGAGGTVRFFFMSEEIGNENIKLTPSARMLTNRELIDLGLDGVQFEMNALAKG